MVFCTCSYGCGVFCTCSDGCGCVELGCKLCALWRLLFSNITFTVHTACIPAPHSHSHNYKCRTPYAAVHTTVLLMMGIMMPETCWDSLIINIRLVASCWFLSLHHNLTKSSNLCPVTALNALYANNSYVFVPTSPKRATRRPPFFKDLSTA
jgi:hypothetical protein